MHTPHNVLAVDVSTMLEQDLKDGGVAFSHSPMDGLTVIPS